MRMMFGAAITLVALWSAPARACKPLIGVVSASTEVPVDGVVALRWRCAGPAPCNALVPASAVVVREAGAQTPAVIEGSIVRQGVINEREGWSFWRPALPFTAGRSYVLSDRESPREHTFTAVTALAFDPQMIPITARHAVLETAAGEEVCCQTDEKHQNSCGTTPCFQRERSERVRLDLRYDRRFPGADQWLYRASFRAAGTTGSSETEAPSSIPLFHWFNRAANEYCYALEAERVSDGLVVQVGEECLPADVGTLRTRTANDSELEQTLAQCKEAPPGFEAAWKAARAAAMEDDPGAQPEPAGDAQAEADAESGGCSVAGTSSASFTAFWPWLLVLLPRLRPARART